MGGDAKYLLPVSKGSSMQGGQTDDAADPVMTKAPPGVSFFAKW